MKAFIENPVEIEAYGYPPFSNVKKYQLETLRYSKASLNRGEAFIVCLPERKSN